MQDSDRLDAAFFALANPTRRAILARLADGQATVNELAEPFAMSLPAISRHIRVLEQAGLVERQRNAQFRPCTLNPQPLEEIARWTERYRPVWDARFDAMQDALNRMKGDEND